MHLKDNIPLIPELLNLFGFLTDSAILAKHGFRDGCGDSKGKDNDDGTDDDDDDDDDEGKFKPENYELDDGYNPERWALTIDDRHHCLLYNALGI